MAFPSYGSWISNILSQPSGSDVLHFITAYTTGSSNTEYALYNTTNTTPFIGFTSATNGVNNIVLSPVTGDYRVHFRLIGYPGDGFNPVVSGCQINYGGLGGTLQTINLGSNTKLSTSKYTVANIDLEGSYTWYLLGSVSVDNGGTWTPIDVYGLDTMITSTTGSEPVIRLYDTTGSVVLTKIIGYFHGSDIN